MPDRPAYNRRTLQRILSTAVLLGLLIATAAAFAVTEKLKLEKSPIYGTLVTQRFGPTCRCATSRAFVSVKVRRRDTVTVTILTGGKRPVRALVSGVPVARGRHVLGSDHAAHRLGGAIEFVRTIVMEALLLWPVYL